MLLVIFQKLLATIKLRMHSIQNSIHGCRDLILPEDALHRVLMELLRLLHYAEVRKPFIIMSLTVVETVLLLQHLLLVMRLRLRFILLGIFQNLLATIKPRMHSMQNLIYGCRGLILPVAVLLPALMERLHLLHYVDVLKP